MPSRRNSPNYSWLASSEKSSILSGSPSRPRSQEEHQRVEDVRRLHRPQQACPKDPFGLPRIDQVIDSTAGCDLLCFLDCYSGYRHIAIKEEDQEKIAFITPFCT
jgi:hypothetical protein